MDGGGGLNHLFPGGGSNYWKFKTIRFRYLWSLQTSLLMQKMSQTGDYSIFTSVIGTERLPSEHLHEWIKLSNLISIQMENE